MEQRDACSGDTRSLHQSAHSRIHLCWRKLAPVQASDGGLLRKGRSSEEREREGWNVQESTQAEISLKAETPDPSEKFHV